MFLSINCKKAIESLLVKSMTIIQLLEQTLFRSISPVVKKRSELLTDIGVRRLVTTPANFRIFRENMAKEILLLVSFTFILFSGKLISKTSFVSLHQQNTT